VALNATGYLTTAADTANYKPIGIAREKVDNSSGSDGDLNCDVWIMGFFIIPYTSAAITDVGLYFHPSADDTLTAGDGSNVTANWKAVSVDTTNSTLEIQLGYR
jgi:hypothetical protein